jgi:hypothetical protein
MLVEPGLRRPLTAVRLDEEWQAAALRPGTAVRAGLSHGGYEPGYVPATMRPGPLPGMLAGKRHAPEPRYG